MESEPSLESFPVFPDEEEFCAPLPGVLQLVDLTGVAAPEEFDPPSQHDSTLSFVNFDPVAE